MPSTKKVRRIRLALGVICLLAGIAFMAHSFLEPKPSPILKPSIISSQNEFGKNAYKLLLAKLPEKAILVFSISDFSAEKDFVLGFLLAGQENDQREYILTSFVPTWGDELKAGMTFIGKPLTEETSELESSVAPTYVVLREKQDSTSNIDLNIEDENGEYQQYSFIITPVSSDGPSNIKCPSRKDAFLLQSIADLDCFRLWIEKNIYRQRHKMDLTKPIGAIDQIDLRHYIIYHTK